MKRLFVFVLAIISLLCVMPATRDHIYTAFRGSDIDDTNHGWEVKKNKTHKQPDIPEQARAILSKYKGVYVGDPESKSIYLTIDLGYESGNTKAVLDVLKRNNVKATFFIVSSYLENNPEIVDRIIDEGHSLQNHTANYRHLNGLTEYRIKREILDLHDAVQKEYGISMKYLRLPYEEWSEKVMKAASETGYKTVFWSVACVDWVEGKEAAYIYNNIVENCHNGAVILLHAVSKTSADALNMIIKYLKDSSYQFRILDM